MSRFAEQFNQARLEELFEDADHRGFATINLKRLLKLLGKGNRAAGTWQALADAYSDFGGDDKKLWISEMSNEIILLATRKVDKVSSWAS